jgi:hypothetical protein
MMEQRLSRTAPRRGRNRHSRLRALILFSSAEASCVQFSDLAVPGQPLAFDAFASSNSQAGHQ